MKKFILALAMTGFAASAAYAQEVDFTKVDADANGGVTIEEAAAAGWTWTPEQFQAADADQDGALNAEEFAAAAAQ